MYKQKTCLVCKKKYSPTSGSQKACISCIPNLDKITSKIWRQNPANKQKIKINSHIYHEKHKTWLKPKRRLYMEKRRKNNPIYRKQNYLRCKDRLKLLRHLASIYAKCANCGIGWPLEVHHKDKNHTNHNIDNLNWICHPCHRKEHGWIAFK